jgi:hypothetical protein
VRDVLPSRLLAPVLSALAVTVVVCAPNAVARYTQAHPVAASLGIADPARSACVRMARVEALVTQNASYRLVLAEVAQAENEAQQAANANSSWMPLLGAVGAIDNGLHEDDSNSSRLGMAVLRSTCRGWLA